MGLGDSRGKLQGICSGGSPHSQCHFFCSGGFLSRSHSLPLSSSAIGLVSLMMKMMIEWGSEQWKKEAFNEEPFVSSADIFRFYPG